MPAPSDLDRRRALLTSALGFALPDTQGRPVPPEQTSIKQWLEHWRATQRPTAREHTGDADPEVVRGSRRRR
jgi:hypothetical protein